MQFWVQVGAKTFQLYSHLEEFIAYPLCGCELERRPAENGWVMNPNCSLKLRRIHAQGQSRFW
jgi:hypothetical protein